MGDIQEIPLTSELAEPQIEAPETLPQGEESAAPVPPAHEEASAAKPRPKARGRPKGSNDTKPRAKPKPKARVIKDVIPVEQQIQDSSSESSADEAVMQEIHALSLIRSIQAYDRARQGRKQHQWASWFGR